MVEKKKAKIYRILSIFATIILLLNFYCIFKQNFVIIISSGNGNNSEAWHNTSMLTTSIPNFKPQITSYDFQYWNHSSSWESSLNQQIDVNNSARYRFIVNITNDQGWDDIKFVNITAWHDQGNEKSYYNQTHGGNLNMKFVYDNTSNDSGSFKMVWPRQEVKFVNSSETVIKNTFTDWPIAESMSLTFEFIPSYQLRYAPGSSNGWNKTKSISEAYTDMSFFNNPSSWNFNITVTNSGKYSGVSETSWVADEFGVYKYSEIYTSEDPYISGAPTNEHYSVNDKGGSGNVTIVARSNTKYSLSSYLSDLIHVSFSGYSISNERISLRGGDRTNFDNFSKGSDIHPIYLYGGGYDGIPEYHPAKNSGINITTSDIEYRCFIPISQEPGEYTSTIQYHLKTN